MAVRPQRGEGRLHNYYYLGGGMLIASMKSTVDYNKFEGNVLVMLK